uniref:Uncharacterized protein n=1 Tax=Schistocephalus solidus TaxID=70667 RepID=A0A0X3NXB3_SCHSO
MVMQRIILQTCTNLECGYRSWTEERARDSMIRAFDFKILRGRKPGDGYGWLLRANAKETVLSVSLMTLPVISLCLYFWTRCGRPPALAASPRHKATLKSIGRRLSTGVGPGSQS